MNPAMMLMALAPSLGGLLLGALTLVEIVRMVIGRKHPLRIAVHAGTSAFYLLLAGLLVPLGGAIAIIWWVLALATLAAGGGALARSRVAAPEAIAAAGRPLPETGPERSAARAARRRVRRASRPSLADMIVTGVLFAAAVVLALLAG